MGLEVTLLIIGAVIVAASFIFSEKADGPETKAELSEKQREDIRKQVENVFDEQADSLREKAEADFDRLAVKKMNEMNEYSDTILGEINKNHNEVMFLYDMLNEKKKEINNTMRDLNSVKKEIKDSASQNGQQEKKTSAQKQLLPKAGNNNSNMESGNGSYTENNGITKQTVRAKGASILDQLDAAAITVDDDTEADEASVPKPKSRRRNSNAKNAADRARNTVNKETERQRNTGSSLGNGNNNEKILELSRQGKSDVEIAKKLGLGIGEVRLVIDLFKGGR